MMSAEKKPHIFILTTGGTIASAPLSSTQVTGYSIAFDADALLSTIPCIGQQYDLEAEELFFVGSSCLQDSHLLQLSRRVNALLARPGIDGVVITHGTDTMEETAFFLNLTVKSHKPVVLTGSMRPTKVLSADGPLNLYQAIQTAAAPESAGKGVLVAFADRLWPARDVMKMSTYHIDTFRCPEGGPLGTVNDRVRYYYACVRPHTLASEFDTRELDSLPNVQIVYGHIDCTDVMLRHALEVGCDGIILAGVGNGAVPSVLRKVLEERPQNGPAIVRSSRVTSGHISPRGGLSDEELHLIPGGSFSPQKARLLLQLALTKTKDYSTLCQIFDRY